MDMNKKLAGLVGKLRQCRLCPHMHPPVVSGGPVMSRVLLVGQAPGDKEPKLGRPFAWTAGKTLFRWFNESAGMNEEQFRSSIYMAAVCRCFPGKNPAGGDRVPSPQEVLNCAVWLKRELDILRPDLVIPVGKKFSVTRDGHSFEVIPLPHPSGASPWHRKEPGKSLLKKAMRLIVKHHGFPIKN
jgi:uracil-DNA glycosylase